MIYKEMTIEEMWRFTDKNRYPIPLKYLKNVLNKLGNPQNKFKSIHVAGSNGKGSTTNALKDVFIEEGLKTAMFTSPHILHSRERMQINNVPINDEDFKKHFLKVIYVLEEEHIHISKPYYGGLYSLIAYSWFAEQEVDIAVVEVGVGGRYDQTNTITPLVSVITNIDLDHIDMLGSTYHEIAFNKGGIIKPNVPCILGDSSNKSVVKTISLISDELKAPLYMKDIDYHNKLLSVTERTQAFNFKNNNKDIDVSISLSGEYQCDNMSQVIQVIDILNTQYGYSISNNTIKNSLLKTIWQGRFEYLTDDIIVDGAHNLAGMKELIKTLNTKYPTESFTLVYANIKTKDYKGMMEYLNKELNDRIKHIIITEIPGDKILSAKELYELCPMNQKLLKESILDAYDTGMKLKGDTKLIICGSLYMMAKIKELISNGQIKLNR